MLTLLEEEIAESESAQDALPVSITEEISSGDAADAGESLSSMEPDDCDASIDSMVDEILPPSGQTNSLSAMTFLVDAVTPTNDVDDKALTPMMMNPPYQDISTAHPSPSHSIYLHESSRPSSFPLQFPLQITVSVANRRVFDEMPLRNRVPKTDLPHQFRDLVTRSEVFNTPDRLPPPKPPDRLTVSMPSLARPILMLLRRPSAKPPNQVRHAADDNSCFCTLNFRRSCLLSVRYQINFEYHAAISFIVSCGFGKPEDLIYLIDRAHNFGLYALKSCAVFHDELSISIHEERQLNALLNSKFDIVFMTLLVQHGENGNMSLLRPDIDGASIVYIRKLFPLNAPKALFKGFGGLVDITTSGQAVQNIVDLACLVSIANTYTGGNNWEQDVEPDLGTVPDANHEAEGIAVLMSLFLVLSRHHFQHGINLNLDLMSHIFRGRCGNLGDHIPLINRTYSFGAYVFKSSFAFHDELAGVLIHGEIKLAKLLNSKLDTNILHLLAHIATGCLPFSISDEVAIIALASNTKVLKGQILLDSISSLKGLTNFMQQQIQFALYALRDTQPSTTFDMFNSLLMEWLINPSFTKDCVVAFVPISFAPVLENTLSITMLKFNFYVQTFIVVVTVAVGAIKNSVDAAINGFSTFKNAHYIFQPIGDILVLSQQAATWFPMVQGDSYLHVGIVALETIGLFELLLAAGCVPFNAADAKNVSLAQQFSKEILVIFPTVLELLVHTCCVCSSPIKEVWIMSSVWKKLAGASLSIPKDTVSKHHSYGIHDNCKLKVVNPSSYSQAFGANVHKVTHGKHASFKGCDASVLLNNTATIVSEQEAFPNINSLRGFDVVNQIKTVVEKVCPNTVSGADILSLVVQISSVMSPGPDWKIPLGRRDGLTANQSRANQNLPAPFNSLDQSKAVFAAQGLTTTDLVALSDCNNVPGKHIVAWAVSFENSKPLISQPLEDTSLGDAPLVGASLNNKEVLQWDPGGSSHILWDGLFVLQANWKVAIVIQHCYFSFNLEDKVAFKGEGIVMNPKAKGMQVKAQGRLGNYGTTINRHLCMERRLSSELY